jgi:hypothetical protein
VEAVNSAFEDVGAKAEECSGTVENAYVRMGDDAEKFGESQSAAAEQVSSSCDMMDVSYRRAMTSSASMIMQGVSMSMVLDRLTKGHIDAGMAALLLTEHFLREGAAIYTLITTYGSLLAAKAASIAADIEEAASTEAHALAEGARSAAIGVSNTVHGIATAIKSSSIAQDAALAAGAVGHAVAEGARQAALYASVIAENALALASGIANAISSMGVAVPIMLAAAAAITAGVLAATGVIPLHEAGGLVTQKSITWVAEKEPELIIPVSRFNEFVTDESERIQLLHSIGVHEPLSLPAFASGGIVEQPTVALVAETEPEAIIPVSRFNEFIIEKTHEITYAVTYRMPHLEVQVPTIIAEGMAATAAGVEGLGLYKKASPLEFLTGPLAGAKEEKGTTIINVEIKDPIFRHKGDLDYLVDRLKRMGMA